MQHTRTLEDLAHRRCLLTPQQREDDQYLFWYPFLIVVWLVLIGIAWPFAISWLKTVVLWMGAILLLGAMEYAEAKDRRRWR